jgi:hypothetical protein
MLQDKPKRAFPGNYIGYVGIINMFFLNIKLFPLRISLRYYFVHYQYHQHHHHFNSLVLLFILIYGFVYDNSNSSRLLQDIFCWNIL